MDRSAGTLPPVLNGCLLIHIESPERVHPDIELLLVLRIVAVACQEHGARDTRDLTESYGANASFWEYGGHGWIGVEGF